MAAKKTAKKTAESVPETAGKPAAPVTKKAAKKAAAKKTATKVPAKKSAKAAKANAPKPTTDAIARAAYLIYRHRVELGLPGDSHNDWLEAERQLGVIR